MSGHVPDFSFAFYERLLLSGKTACRVRLFSELGQSSPEKKPTLVIRHDLDVSLTAALPIARLEQRCGVRATYMPLVRSPLYSVGDAGAREFFAEVLELGHDIGLHFDPPPAYRAEGALAGDLEAAVEADCRLLEEAVGRRIESVSFHRPLQKQLRGPDRIAGRVNAYAQALMGAYCSDSKGTWHAGDPVAHVSAPAAEVVQLLTHPIWWGETHVPAEERLQMFYDEQTRGLDSISAAAFDDSLEASVPAVRRSGRAKHHSGKDADAS